MADNNRCQNCGELLRDGAEFCTKCGFSPSIDYTAVSDVPFIALAPVERLPFHKRLGRIIRLLLATVAAVAICMLAISVSVLVTTSTGANRFVEVDTSIYQTTLTMINDVRGDQLSERILEDIVKDEGDAEGKNFREEYEAKFNQLQADQGEDLTVEELYYIHAGYYTWFCEYYAKRYEYKAENAGLLSFNYVDKAREYRSYADWCYEQYCGATTEAELRSIVEYLEDRGILSDGTLKTLEAAAEKIRVKS